MAVFLVRCYVPSLDAQPAVLVPRCEVVPHLYQTQMKMQMLQKQGTVVALVVSGEQQAAIPSETAVQMGRDAVVQAPVGAPVGAVRRREHLHLH